MAKILYSSRRRSDRRRPGFVEAASLAEAQEKLTAAGHRDIRYHSDPNIAEPVGDNPELALRVTDARTAPGLGKFVLDLCLATMGMLGGASFLARGYWFWGIVSMSVAVLLVAYAVPLRLFHRVRFEMSRCRYERAMFWLRPLQVIAFILPKGTTVRVMLIGEEARILAGQRRLDRALEVLGTLRPKHERLYELQLSTLYHRARDFETARRLDEERVAREPDAADARVQLAMTLALRFEELDAAREQIARAAVLPATEIVRACSALTEAVLLEETDPRSALLRADDARRFCESLGPHVARGWLALIGAFRARALARVGDIEGASRELAAVSPMLLEAEEHELVDQSWDIVLARAELPDAAASPATGVVA